MVTKNFLYALMAFGLVCIACESTNSEAEAEPEVVEAAEAPFATDAPFSLLIEEDNSRPHLPALQSFVLATSGEKWLMFAGRTNGMHAFTDYENLSFPVKKFNEYIYVCDATSCDSMAITNIKTPYRDMFRATNLQHYQDGGTLYITGGYGETLDPKGTVDDWDTYPYIGKIDIDKLISIVEGSSKDELNTAMKFGTSEHVRATGGELFKMQDDFYLTVGHVFTGTFTISNKKAKTKQVYLDAVHRFSVTENDSGGLDVQLVQKITDGFADDTTQFRRRDLPVARTLVVQDDNTLPALTLYAGVFTNAANKIPGLVKNENFVNPIHIYNDSKGNGQDAFQVDARYTQYNSVYACPSFVAYDSGDNMLYTTLLGGIGSGENQAKPGSADTRFTNETITINQVADLKSKTSSTTTMQMEIPGAVVEYIQPSAAGKAVKYGVSQTVIDSTTHLVRDTLRYGAEANFILSDAAKLKGHPSIFDIAELSAKDTIQVGQFYGGIQAWQANPGNFGKGLSFASNKVFKVSIVKR